MTDMRRQDTPGFITIVRHGEPDADRRQRVDWRGYERWWADYEERGLRDGQAPPPALLAQAEQAVHLFSSPAPRALETAQACAGGKPIEVDSVFVEAALPPPPFPGRMSARTWGVPARCAWWLGFARGKESRGQAERRAAQAADRLVEAARTGPVMLFAHGWFNRMLRPALKRRGYACVRDGGDVYWSWRRYEPKAAARGG
ncbi:histidine phosphatase family protein [Marinicauda salina]|uniref:Histidine phosphatase family protein n=1 Tax=Marinicauda salina TaxID=2135793 RepID=A0A2U2BSF5_9PROT|nr:histidine phosphatase family protein [Marinicauda salina]PWE16955.1 histidine phosphatase family protein [Marinicauda salina]